jgi:glycosyltransferase involved in cell wall biosynthesis
VLVDGVNARLVPPDSPADLARGLLEVLDDPALGARLASRAREDVAGRTWDARALAVRDFVVRCRQAPSSAVPSMPSR